MNTSNQRRATEHGASISTPSAQLSAPPRLRVIPHWEISKPRKIVVPLAVGLAWGNDPQYRIEEKLDGRFETRQVFGTTEDLGDTLLAGEYLRGEFHAFDLLRLNGTDFRPYPLEHRLVFLAGVFAAKPLDRTGGEIHRVPALHYQPSTLHDIWTRGGEGIVRKRLDAPWGTPFEACKRIETFTCTVTGFNAGQSVQISLADHPCGNVALKGGKCDRVRVGSILKIEGFGLTREGQIREGRVCKDSATSWLVKY